MAFILRVIDMITTKVLIFPLPIFPILTWWLILNNLPLVYTEGRGDPPNQGTTKWLRGGVKEYVLAIFVNITYSKSIILKSGKLI